MSTIYEVAARASVSPATVSRFLNGSFVAPDKAERIEVAVKELGYRPNRAARSLRTKSSELIALVIPDVENPFFTSLARGAEDVTRAADFSLVLCNSDGDLGQEAHYLEVAANERMAGMIIAAAAETSDLTPITSRGLPVVAVDRVPRGLAIDSVRVDDRAGGRWRRRPSWRRATGGSRA